MKTKVTLTIIILSILLIGSMASVMATDIISDDGVAPTSWLYNLLHSSGLTSNPFSVVGDSRGCSLNADLTWNLANGETLPAQYASDYCGSGGGLFDVFRSGWNPYLEYKDSVSSLTCSSFEGCHVELYCCDNPEPTSCDSGETLETKSCLTCTSSIWSAYSCPSATTGYVCGGEQQILYARSSYKYCKTADTKTCYYKTTPTGTCLTRTYTTLSDCSGQTYMGWQLYNSFSECSNAACTPDNSCAANTCTGQTCTNNCGTSIQGTKTDGTCAAVNPLDTKLEVVNIYTAPIVGETLGINPSASMEREFVVTLKNTGTISETVNVEAGFYTPEYATDIAQLPNNNLFSLWSSQGTTAQNCVGSEGFVTTQSVTIGPGETKIVYLKQSPITAYMTKPLGTYVLSATKLVSYIGVYKTCCQKLEGFEGCATGTGGFVNDKDGKQIYKVNWNFANADTLMLNSDNILCGDGTIYGNVNYKTIGEDTITVSKDWKQCVNFKFYEINGTLDINATNNFSSIATLNSIKKIAYTESDIKDMTSNDMLAIACLKTDECVSTNSSLYNAKCVPISTLRDRGTIPTAKVTDFFSNTATVLKTGLYAGVGTTTACIVAAMLPAGFFGLGVGALVASPAIIGGCAALGAIGGATLQIAYFDITDNDALVQKLKAKDANSVGLCVAESKSGFDNALGFLAWFDINGDGQKNGTDGMIIGGILLLVLVLVIKK